MYHVLTMNKLQGLSVDHEQIATSNVRFIGGLVFPEVYTT